MKAKGQGVIVLTLHGHLAAQITVRQINGKRECKVGGTSDAKMSNKLEVPKATTPHQSPQQKQLKMTDLEAHSPMPAPMENEPSPRIGS